MTTTRQQIDDFLALKRIAVVGVSRNPKELSTTIWQELRQRRYDVVPVNPKTDVIDGQRCFASVRDIQPPVDGVLIMTSPNVTEAVVRDCAAAGVRHVWMHRGMGRGSVSQEAVRFCEANGIDVVDGSCPYMFLPGTPFFHGLHAFGKKLTGSFPR
ncbi:MAG: CoA-binding protein [Aeromicrobium sp.]